MNQRIFGLVFVRTLVTITSLWATFAAHAQTSSPLAAIAQVATGFSHSCAVSTSGGVFCWGDNAKQQLGRSTPAQSLVATNVPGLATGVQMVALGAEHTCALTAAGGVKCWGGNNYGQTGTGSAAAVIATPSDVVGLTSGVIFIASGAWHTCALTATNGVLCWGRNEDGQTGSGSISTKIATPTQVSGLTSGVAMISSGGFYTCAQMMGGAVNCWGDNYWGYFGNGTTSDSSTPTPSSALQGVLSNSILQPMSAGYFNNCVITNAGGVKCFGDNSYGQLGVTNVTSSASPLDVPAWNSGVTRIATAANFACALTAAGVQCLGDNSNGQLGKGTTGGAFNATPSAVTNLSEGVSQISAVLNHACAVTQTGGVKCWGANSGGQLGNNSTIATGTPAAVLLGEPAPVNLPIIFNEDFDGPVLAPAKWTETKFDSRANAGTLSFDTGRMLVAVPGGSLGSGGVSDGSDYTPNVPALTGDYDIVISGTEILRQQIGGYKDNSGLQLLVGNKTVVIAGNYSGYWFGVGYNEYNKHRIHAGAADGTSACLIDESLSLATMYQFDLSISRTGTAVQIGYRLNGGAWTYVPCGTQTGTVSPKIRVYSGDGGGTVQNGRFTVAVDSFIVRADVLTDGACGTADGVATATPPSQATLCSAGTPSAITTGTTNYSWTCSGTGGGTTASCSAPKAATSPNIKVAGDLFAFYGNAKVDVSQRLDGYDAKLPFDETDMRIITKATKFILRFDNTTQTALVGKATGLSMYNRFGCAATPQDIVLRDAASAQIASGGANPLYCALSVKTPAENLGVHQPTICAETVTTPTESSCIIFSHRVAIPALDQDGDSIPDDWEENGVPLDAQGVVRYVIERNNALPAPSRNTKDVFLWIDEMAGLEHALKASALEDVVKVFQRRGINLHIWRSATGGNIWGTPIPEKYLPFEELTNVDNASVEERLKRNNFYESNFTGIGTVRDSVFYYMAYVNSFGITIGNEVRFPVGYAPSGFNFTIFGNGNKSDMKRREYQSSTIMHEFGHHLGLGHNGPRSLDRGNTFLPDADRNYTPGYLSIMNYNYQDYLVTSASARRLDPLVGLDYSSSARNFSFSELKNDAMNNVVAPTGYGVNIRCATLFGLKFDPIRVEAGTKIQDALVSAGCEFPADLNRISPIGEANLEPTGGDWENVLFGFVPTLGDGYKLLSPSVARAEGISNLERKWDVTEATPGRPRATSRFAVDAISPSVVFAKPGQTVFVPIEIQNVGTENDTFLVTASSTYPVGENQRAVISAGQKATVNVLVSIPPNEVDSSQSRVLAAVEVSIWGQSGGESASSAKAGTAIQIATIDTDNDGIPDAVESAGPNNGDANGDGIPDKDQKNVGTIFSPAGNGYVTFEVSGGCSVAEAISAYTESQIAVQDTSWAYPFGLVSFRLPCSAATVKLYYHGVTSLTGYTLRRYGPTTPGNATTSTWTTVPNATFGTATVGASTVATASYGLSDGQPGDDTGIDGVIVDPVGPALYVGGPVDANGNPIPVPTNDRSGVIMLAMMLLLAGGLSYRRQRQRWQ